MGDRRIFIAVDISYDARVAIAAHIDHLRTMHSGERVRWEQVEKLHVTMKFLGKTSADRLEEVIRRVHEIAHGEEKFHLSLSGTGVFPSKAKPRIFWVGLDDPAQTLSRIAEGLNKELVPLGFEPETRRFRPHITIGRSRDPQRLSDTVQRHLEAQIEPVAFEVTELVVYESKLEPTGSRYSVVSKAELARQ